MTKNLPRKNRSALRLGSNVFTLVWLAAVLGCVTVNIHLPESAVKQAADDFVRDLYGGSAEIAATDTDDAEKESDSVKDSVRKSSDKKGKVPATETPPHTWNLKINLIETAQAADFNTDTPKAQELKTKLKARAPQIKDWKSKGIVCETEDGHLRMKNAAKAGSKAAEVAKIVREQNADRDAFYQEVTNANPAARQSVEKVGRIFGAAFRERSPAAGRCD